MEESLKEGGDKKKSRGIFASMLEDDEDSIDIEKAEAETQTEPPKHKCADIQTEPMKENLKTKEEKKVESVPSGRSSRVSVTSTPAK